MPDGTSSGDSQSKRRAEAGAGRASNSAENGESASSEDADSGRTRMLPKSAADGAAADASAANDLESTQSENSLSSLDASEVEGRMLGEFKLIRRLGVGGMAEVYLAEQTSLKRRVAVKVLKRELVSESDDVLLKRFEQEATAAAGLSHPNIVQVYMTGEEDGVHYIAQEYVQGLNLREYLKKNGPPKPAASMKIMRQVAAALEAAHEAGVVHRDVKPENIMLTKKGEVKVADFGLARLAHGEEGLNLTQVGMTMGTPLYMSPEQVNGGEIDRRSDVYSLGVTCYHMLADRPPFRGETAISVAVQHLKETPTPLTELRSDLPPAMCRIVHKMMEKQPVDRYQDAAAIQRDLRRLAEAMKRKPDGGEISLSGFEFSEEAPRTLFSRPSGKQIALFLLVTLLVGGASAGAGWLMRPADPFEAPAPVADGNLPVLSTAGKQYMAALRLVDNEDAWRLVIDKFNDQVYMPRALAQLAMLHLRKGELEAADEEFKRLLTLSGRDQAMKAIALAGRAVIESLNGNHEESQKLIALQLEPVADNLTDDNMKLFVREAINRNLTQLDEKTAQDSKKLLQKFRQTEADAAGFNGNGAGNGNENGAN